MATIWSNPQRNAKVMGTVPARGTHNKRTGITPYMIGNSVRFFVPRKKVGKTVVKEQHYVTIPCHDYEQARAMAQTGRINKV